MEDPAGFREEQPLECPQPDEAHSPIVADWVRSPTAASEHSGSQNLGLADWPLSGNRFGRFGSRAASQALRKQSLCRMSAHKGPQHANVGHNQPVTGSELLSLERRLYS